MDLKILYNSHEIKKLFKPIMKINIFDDLTIKHFEKKYLKGITEKDLKIMLETIESERKAVIHIQSSGMNVYNSLFSLLSSISTIGIALIVMIATISFGLGETDVLLESVNSIKGMLFIILFIAIVISFVSIRNSISGLKFNKLEKTIKVLIAIKNEE